MAIEHIIKKRHDKLFLEVFSIRFCTLL